MQNSSHHLTNQYQEAITKTERGEEKTKKKKKQKTIKQQTPKTSCNLYSTIPPGKNYPLPLKYTNQVMKVKTVHLRTLIVIQLVHLRTLIQLVKSYKPHAIAVKLMHTFQKTRHSKTQPCKLNRKSISDHTRQGHHQNSRVGRHKHCYTKCGNGGLTEAVSKSIQLWYCTTVYKEVTDESKKVKVKQKVTMQCFSAAVRPHYLLTLFHIIINTMHSF